MWTRPRGGGRTAAGLRALARQKKTAPHRKRRGLDRRNHRRYREFLRHGRGRFYRFLAELIAVEPPPWWPRLPGTPGRPPTDPHDVVRFLLLKHFEGWSYDETHAQLEALPELAHKLGFRGRVPAASTVVGLVEKVPIRYLERMIASTGAELTHGKRTHAAGDATGLATRRYSRWFDVRHGKSSRRRSFVKLHALIATKAEWPFFLAARVTGGNWGDAPQLEPLVDQLDPDLELGNVALDRGYPSRKNAQRIEDRGGLPVIDLRANITRALALGYPAWRRMIHRQREDRRAFRCRYRRRAVIEGLFGAFKRRFGESVLARRRHAQRMEILSRVLLWNVLGQVYHSDRRSTG